MEKNDNLKLEAFITNLGKYNEGELVGEWVEFPCSPETMSEVLERIGIGSEDEFGNPYEEYFITDYDGNMPREMYNQLGEYISIETLQVVGEILNRINELGDQGKAMFEGLLEQFNYLDAAENVLNNRAYTMSGVENDYDLGAYVFENYYDGGDTFPRDKAEMYFDYETFGRHMRDEYNAYNEETINEYLGLDDNADDYEIGEAYVNEVLGSLSEVGNINEYVDFEAFGRDIDMEGQIIYADGFAIDYSDCEELGEDFYEEVKGDLIDNGILTSNDKDEQSYDDEER